MQHRCIVYFLPHGIRVLRNWFQAPFNVLFDNHLYSKWCICKFKNCLNCVNKISSNGGWKQTMNVKRGTLTHCKKIPLHKNYMSLIAIFTCVLFDVEQPSFHGVTYGVFLSTIFICPETSSYADFWAPNVCFPEQHSTLLSTH